MEINGVTISKKLAEWIEKRVVTYPEPNTFLIRVPHGALNFTAHELADKTFMAVLEWVRRYDGDIELIDNTYPRVSKASNGYYKLRIFSPVCEGVIESILDKKKQNELQLQKERAYLRSRGILK